MPPPKKKITVRGFLINPANRNSDTYKNLVEFRRRQRAITRRIQKKVNSYNKNFQNRFTLHKRLSTLRRGNNGFNSENINPEIFHRDNPPNITYLPIQVLPKNHVSPLHVWNPSFTPMRPPVNSDNHLETVFNPLFSNPPVYNNEGELHHAFNNSTRKRLKNKFSQINDNEGPVHHG